MSSGMPLKALQVFMKVPVSKNQKTEKTAENNTSYHHFIKIRLPENMSEESLLGKLVQNNEARKVKCICGGNWKTVSANQVELIGGLKQESEACVGSPRNAYMDLTKEERQYANQMSSGMPLKALQVFMKVPVSKNQKTEKTAENNTSYHHFIKIRLPENMSEESLLGKLVQNNEARKVKCICGGNWKTVSANQVELIGGLKQESEAW
ncbi:hypothetical protein T07_396 [Trichinella nelsoni]|uniref:Uncharacterized protein n=1 Tax=Trichinella nelsoni TaxID=6336 RepID=A0A0V0SD18_9BILA|nr:hypothetical protein T07_396 [Trichinella nelsoni]